MRVRVEGDRIGGDDVVLVVEVEVRAEEEPRGSSPCLGSSLSLIDE